ncbi:carboxypeptidase-like regulatory domain-containing protein, partial [Bizionia paragorgiae]
MLNKIAVLFFSVFAVQLSYSQATIKGTIFNENKETVAFANVLIKGTVKGTASNETGSFELKNLSWGDYTIEISSVGFKP